MCQDCSDSHNNEMHTPDTIGQDPNRARQLTQHMRSPSYKIGGASHAILLAAIHCNVCCSHTRAQINQLCQGTLDPPHTLACDNCQASVCGVLQPWIVLECSCWQLNLMPTKRFHLLQQCAGWLCRLTIHKSQRTAVTRTQVAADTSL